MIGLRYLGGPLALYDMPREDQIVTLAAFREIERRAGRLRDPDPRDVDDDDNPSGLPAACPAHVVEATPGAWDRLRACASRAA